MSSKDKCVDDLSIIDICRKQKERINELEKEFDVIYKILRCENITSSDPVIRGLVGLTRGVLAIAMRMCHELKIMYTHIEGLWEFIEIFKRKR